MQTEGAYILIPGPIRRGITNIVLRRILLLMRSLGALHGASDALMMLSQAPWTRPPDAHDAVLRLSQPCMRPPDAHDAVLWVPWCCDAKPGSPDETS